MKKIVVLLLTFTILTFGSITASAQTITKTYNQIYGTVTYTMTENSNILHSKQYVKDCSDWKVETGYMWNQPIQYTNIITGNCSDQDVLSEVISAFGLSSSHTQYYDTPVIRNVPKDYQNKLSKLAFYADYKWHSFTVTKTISGSGYTNSFNYSFTFEEPTTTTYLDIMYK